MKVDPNQKINKLSVSKAWKLKECSPDLKESKVNVQIKIQNNIQNDYKSWLINFLIKETKKNIRINIHVTPKRKCQKIKLKIQKKSANLKVFTIVSWAMCYMEVLLKEILALWFSQKATILTIQRGNEFLQLKIIINIYIQLIFF